MLWKETRSSKEVVDTQNVFIMTTMEIDGLSVLKGISPPPTTASLLEVIELFDKHNLLTLTRFQGY